MAPHIEIIAEKKLVGKHLRMSLARNSTFQLWNSFMPRRKEISNAVTSNLVSMQVYDEGFDFKGFSPTAEFEKWAAVEVSDFNHIPTGLEPFTLTGGMYAVFIHHGHHSTGAKTFDYIFASWLPASDYMLDNRPHFELLGAKYNNNSDDSEEEIWIPIKPKA